MMSGVARCRQLGIQTPKSIAPPLLIAAPRPAGSVRIARLGPGGPSPRPALRLALRPRDGLRRALLSAPELAGGQRRALGKRLELRPRDLWMHAAAQAAVGRGDDPLP